jgi:hypothetical protein
VLFGDISTIHGRLYVRFSTGGIVQRYPAVNSDIERQMEESKSHGPIHHTTNGTMESYHRIDGHAMPGAMAGDAEYMPTAVVRRWGATKLPTKLILKDFSQSEPSANQYYSHSNW